MIERADAYEFLISDWDYYRPHIGCLKHIAYEFPGKYKLIIKSYKSENGLSYVFSDIDIHNPELEKQLIDWREKNNYKVFSIGLTKNRKDKESLLYLKKILKKYFGHDKVHIDLINEDKTLELKEITVDSNNPSLHSELFRFLDIEQEEAPF